MIKTLARTFLTRAQREKIYYRYVDWRTEFAADRIFMGRHIVPAIAKAGPRALFVGCKSYTAKYPAIFAKAGSECWTIDIDPRVAKYGAAGRHQTLDVRHLRDAFPVDHFDSLTLSGIFGFGVNSVEMQNETLAACAGVLKSGGLLVLGWNTDRIADPSELVNMAYFEPTTLGSLGSETRFADTTHVFQYFRKRQA